MEYWVQVAQSFGVPVACLVVLCVAIWKILSWVGERVVIPVVQKHLDFMDKMSKALERLAEDMSEVKQKVVVRAESVSIIPQARSDSIMTSPQSTTQSKSS